MSYGALHLKRGFQVELRLFGEVHFVPRTAWSPFFLKGVFFYVFGVFWVLEFLSFSNKYITSQARGLGSCRIGPMG